MTKWAGSKIVDNRFCECYGPNNRLSLIGSPEFVVEVRSPSNSRTKDKAKRKRYFDNGAEIIWDVDDKKQVIYVYRLDSQKKPQTYTKNQEIDCEPLLPGWRRRVSDLFEDETPVEVIFSEVHAEGEKVGEVRAKQDTLIRLLQARFLDTPQEILNTIKQTHDMAQLDGWFDQAIMAPTLGDLNI